MPDLGDLDLSHFATSRAHAQLLDTARRRGTLAVAVEMEVIEVTDDTSRLGIHEAIHRSQHAMYDRMVPAVGHTAVSAVRFHSSTRDRAVGMLQRASQHVGADTEQIHAALTVLARHPSSVLLCAFVLVDRAREQASNN